MSWRPVFARLLVAAAALGQVVASEPSSTRLVSVDVLVTDQQERPVGGLETEDFEIVAAGETREIQSVSIGRTPLDIVLLMDLTASISNTLQRKVLEEDVERALIYALKEGEQLRIGAFSRRLVVTPSLTRDGRRLQSELRTAISHGRLELYGPSPIWDSIISALEYLSPPPARRALILITDGRATGNVHSVADAARMAMLRATAIHIVGQDLEVLIPASPTTSVAVRPGNVLNWLADVTGGRFVSATALGERPAVPIATILECLRNTYSVTFEVPPLTEGPHQLAVRVKRADVKVRARSVFSG